MGTDPDDANPPDEADGLADLDIGPELREELQGFMERTVALVSEPQTEDEHGDPPPRLDVENPPATPPEDPLLRVGYALLVRLPEHWPSAMLQVNAAADEVRTQTMIFGDVEAPMHQYHFMDLTEPCLALRRATYERDGRGAWYSAMIWLYRNGAIRPFYNYSSPPFGTWGPREVELLLQDQELYPRDPENLPPWHPAHW